MPRRTHWLKIRVSPTEYHSIQQAAQSHNLTVSSYLRSLPERHLHVFDRIKFHRYYRELTQALFDLQQSTENADFSGVFTLLLLLEQEVCR